MRKKWSTEKKGTKLHQIWMVQTSVENAFWVFRPFLAAHSKARCRSQWPQCLPPPIANNRIIPAPDQGSFVSTSRSTARNWMVGRFLWTKGEAVCKGSQRWQCARSMQRPTASVNSLIYTGSRATEAETIWTLISSTAVCWIWFFSWVLLSDTRFNLQQGFVLLCGYMGIASEPENQPDWPLRKQTHTDDLFHQGGVVTGDFCKLLLLFLHPVPDGG